MTTICGNDCCKNCSRLSECGGCDKCNGSPFGGKCVAAECIKNHGKEAYEQLKSNLINEINALGIDGLRVEDLNLLNGFFVNLEYPLTNGTTAKFLEDKNIYFGNQIEQTGRDCCFGVVADENMIIVCEYEAMGANPRLLRYISR